MLTVDYITKTLGGVQKAADFFGVTRTALYKWRARGIPEEIHFICHCSKFFNYTYEPSAFGRDGKALGLVLENPTTKPNDEVTTNDDTIYLQAS